MYKTRKSVFTNQASVEVPIGPVRAGAHQARARCRSRNTASRGNHRLAATPNHPKFAAVRANRNLLRCSRLRGGGLGYPILRGPCLGAEGRVDTHRHEEGLESDLPLRTREEAVQGNEAGGNSTPHCAGWPPISQYSLVTLVPRLNIDPDLHVPRCSAQSFSSATQPRPLT